MEIQILKHTPEQRSGQKRTQKRNKNLPCHRRHGKTEEAQQEQF